VVCSSCIQSNTQTTAFRISILFSREFQKTPYRKSFLSMALNARPLQYGWHRSEVDVIYLRADAVLAIVVMKAHLWGTTLIKKYLIVSFPTHCNLTLFCITSMGASFHERYQPFEQVLISIYQERLQSTSCAEPILCSLLHSVCSNRDVRDDHFRAAFLMFPRKRRSPLHRNGGPGFCAFSPPKGIKRG
jgi:hypothetical protein